MGSLAVLLANPAAGSFRQESLDRVVRLIRERGLSVEIMTSHAPGDVTRLASRCAGLSPEVVFVLGGDGTYNEAVNGLVHAPVPLAFLPLGTVNVLARELGIPRDPRAAVDKALRAKPRAISLGRVAREGMDDRYFTLMAGAGFDACSVYAVDQKTKRIAGRFAYVLSGMRVLAGYRPGPIMVSAAETACRGYSVIVGKAGCYGGSFSVTPDASLFDPSLYVFVLKDPGRAAVLRAALNITMKRHRGSSGIEYFRTDAVTLGGDARLQLDGDYAGTLPAAISVERDCLKILA